jgi:hypothetical protein
MQRLAVATRHPLDKACRLHPAVVNLVLSSEPGNTSVAAASWRSAAGTVGPLEISRRAWVGEKE